MSLESAASQLDLTSVPLTNQDLIRQTCHARLSMVLILHILHAEVSLMVLLCSGHKGASKSF